MSTTFKLISATPSPYARKVRIALVEKGIPFQLETEVPWDSTTQTSLYNPLEKLPILLVPSTARGSETNNHASGAASAHDEVTPVYESHFILEWLETKYPTPALLPANPDQRLAAKQYEVVCDGMCDALVLRFFETQRGPEKMSLEWQARQERKVRGGVKWLNEKVQNARADGIKTFLIGDGFCLADIAVGTVLGYMAVRAKHVDWEEEFPALGVYFHGLMQRESFGATVPYAQKFRDKIV